MSDFDTHVVPFFVVPEVVTDELCIVVTDELCIVVVPVVVPEVVTDEFCIAFVICAIVKSVAQIRIGVPSACKYFILGGWG